MAQRGDLSLPLLCSCHLFNLIRFGILAQCKQPHRAALSFSKSRVRGKYLRSGWLKYFQHGRCCWIPVSIGEPWILIASTWSHASRKEVWVLEEQSSCHPTDGNIVGSCSPGHQCARRGLVLLAGQRDQGWNQLS